MNMPLDQEGKVNFTTTLFALIRENLNIKMRAAEEMDQADIELRDTILKVWPFTAKDKIELLVPTTRGKLHPIMSIFESMILKLHLEIGKGKLTVGKIYGGLLILENWKQTKFGSSPAPSKADFTRIIARTPESPLRDTNQQWRITSQEEQDR